MYILIVSWEARRSKAPTMVKHALCEVKLSQTHGYASKINGTVLYGIDLFISNKYTAFTD